MEIHGYTEFGSISATIEGLLLSIPDDMSNSDRRRIWDEWEMAEMPPGTPDDERVRVNTIPPFVKEIIDETYKLYKSKFIERLTNEEASALEIVLNDEEPKLRMMFNSVEYFVSDDPLFAVLHWTLMQELGEERADELLAQESIG